MRLVVDRQVAATVAVDVGELAVAQLAAVLRVERGHGDTSASTIPRAGSRSDRQFTVGPLQARRDQTIARTLLNAPRNPANVPIVATTAATTRRRRATIANTAATSTTSAT